MAAESEHDLRAVRAVLGGERGAFREIVERHASGLFAFVGSLLGAHQDREDAVQDAFLSAFRSLSSFDPERGSLRGWLFTIARNRALNMRRKKRPVTVARVPEPPAEPRHEPEGFKDLDRALARLPAEQRSAFLLSEVHGFTYQEVARIEGVKQGTVKSRIARAREKLRRALARPSERTS